MTTKIDFTKRTIHSGFYDFQYAEDDFVNASSYCFHHNIWKHNIKLNTVSSPAPIALVVHNAGFVVAIVFPEYFGWSEQDALDAAADSGKLDFLKISVSELVDYETGRDSEGNPEYDGIVYLGNASEPFDSEALEYFTVPATLFAEDPVIAKVIAENPNEDDEEEP